MMVTGERAELRGLNLEGLRRNGFTMSEVWHCVTVFSLLTLECYQIILTFFFFALVDEEPESSLS